MVEVPEDQKIEYVPPTKYNHESVTRDSLTETSGTIREGPIIILRHHPQASGGIGQLRDLTWGRGDEFVLDFGLHLVGHVAFHLDAEGLNIDAPCRLHLTFGESPFDVTERMDDIETWISTSWLPDETINIDFMPEDVTIPRRQSFRYLRVQIIDTSPKYKVAFSNFIVTSVSAVPSDSQLELYSFGENDTLLETIDEISVLTLRDCMQTVFEDGPRRDRRMWIGDLRLQALTSYHTIKDFNLAKRCLFMFAALPREDGSLPACLFEKPKLTPATDYIVDYDALFGVIVHDYGSLSGALAHLDPTTHVFDTSRSKSWKFLDWADNLDKSAGMHGLLLYCLKHVNQLARLLSIDPLPYIDTINLMTTAAAKTFLDPSTNTITSGPNAQISLASAAWLTLAGALPPQTCRQALLSALHHPDTIHPLTPYLYHHLIDALATVHLYDEAISILKRYWGGMVIAGADTFWECFDEKDPRRIAGSVVAGSVVAGSVVAGSVVAGLVVAGSDVKDWIVEDSAVGDSDVEVSDVEVPSVENSVVEDWVVEDCVIEDSEDGVTTSSPLIFDERIDLDGGSTTIRVRLCSGPEVFATPFGLFPNVVGGIFGMQLHVDLVDEVVEVVVEDAVKEVVDDLVEDVVCVALEDVVEEVLDDVVEEVLDDVVEEVLDDVLDEVVVGSRIGVRALSGVVVVEDVVVMIITAVLEPVVVVISLGVGGSCTSVSVILGSRSHPNPEYTPVVYFLQYVCMPSVLRNILSAMDS
ncbi:uncharacterized protein AB675_4915 [Cyphellophora attinorum]|uniref:Uncharacterized protein n=1 Tax=Cyphellophora attinorum TaxID=1664694 RepID=A0A0N1HGL6_9EURO|nr:uncharacterized protein AB675_4915 [Phialophora attinorum]KPI34600.1 hypothetical protein AB675_4915 [Phialophora attinorum]